MSDTLTKLRKLSSDVATLFGEDTGIAAAAIQEIEQLQVQLQQLRDVTHVLLLGYENAANILADEYGADEVADERETVASAREALSRTSTQCLALHDARTIEQVTEGVRLMYVFNACSMQSEGIKKAVEYLEQEANQLRGESKGQAKEKDL